MRYAIDSEGKKVEVQKTGQRAFCPGCGEELISRCGDVNAPHWAHTSSNPDKCHKENKYHPMSAWHRERQDWFDKKFQEVWGQDNEGNQYRADVLNSNGVCIEFQHSNLSAEIVKKREKYYDKLIWVLDIETFPITGLRKNTQEFREIGYVESSEQIDNLTAAEIEWIIKKEYSRNKKGFEERCYWTKYLNENNNRFYFDKDLHVGYFPRKVDMFNKYVFIDDRQGNLWYKYKNHPIVTYFRQCQPKVNMLFPISVDDWEKNNPDNYMIQGIKCATAQPYDGLIKSISYEDFIKKYNV